MLPRPLAYVAAAHPLHVPPVPASPASHESQPVLPAFTSDPSSHVAHSEFPSPLAYVAPVQALQ